MIIDWAQFKTFHNARKTDILMFEDSNYYYLFTIDYGFSATCNIDKNASDTTELDDFENNYKAECNPVKQDIVRTATPVNEHCMESWGCVKNTLYSNGKSCPITLSNRSVDGYTFNYNHDLTIEPSIGNYVFMNNSINRSWIVAVDNVNHTITMAQEQPILPEGSGIYSVGTATDCILPNWSNFWYLWGVTSNARWNNTTEEDIDAFVELSVVDVNDMFKNDDYCMALFGVVASEATPYIEAMGFENFGEFGDHWTKYYDESWMLNVRSKYTPAPDGSPGKLLSGLCLRLNWFNSIVTNTKVDIYLDYYLTTMDE